MDLHLITDTTLQHRHTHLALAEAAYEAQVAVVQYREKHYQPHRHQTELEQIIRSPLKGQTRLLVNDDVTLAQSLGADGAHIGQTDISPKIARNLLGEQALLGVTIHTMDELFDLINIDVVVDYIGVGPVFGTNSKNTGLQPLGLKKLAEFCNLSPYGVVAIGGIGLSELPKLAGLGLQGVAVLGAFCLADNPGHAARELQAVASAIT